MSKFVVLNIDEGSFEEGFPVRLEIGTDGKTKDYETKVKLTRAPDIPRLYQDWQDRYRELGETSRDINVPNGQITNRSVIRDVNQARNRFDNYLHEWFNQLPWEKLRVSIQEKTQPHESIRVIINTENIYLKKLPWHLWQLFRNRPHAEPALSAERALPGEALKRPVKILAIFGGSEGLDLTSDRELIAELRHRGAKVTWLEKPERKELSQNLWKKHWDILFFAGHSSSKEECKTGEIEINDSESISLTLLRNALKTAVKKGLKLAIFNSCDGLGLADELIGVKVPQMIVMREPVPDKVARHFLEYFLEDFSTGDSLYSAVRNARERLEEMEDDFPCATWLPVIYQNPAEPPFVWPKSLINNPKKLIVGGVAIALILIGNQIYKKIFPTPSISQSQPTSELQPIISSSINSPDTLKDLGANFSWGEEILITSNSNQWKRDGQKAFKERNYNESIIHFDESLKTNKDDPETLIYLNNAVAMKPSKMYKLRVTTTANGKVCNINRKPLKIAVIAPSIANLENEINQEILRGVAQAQNETNVNCGIEGRMLQIMIVDDNNKPTQSSQVAKKLVNEKDDILAVVGHYSSGVTESAGKVYQNKMVVISPSSTAVRKSANKNYGLDLNKYVFRTSTNDEITNKKLVNYMVNRLGQKKATIAYNSSKPYSDNFRKEFENKLKSVNGELIIFPQCDLDNNPDLKKCMERAKEEVNIMMLVPATDESFKKVSKMLNTSNDLNMKFLGADSLESEKARNLVIALPWFHNEDNPSEFENDFLKLWGTKEVSWRTAMSYDATTAIIEGLRRIIKNGGNPTAEELQKVLSAEDFSAKGAAGKFKFDQNGDRKITSENDPQIAVLIQLKCDNQTLQGNCEFVRVLPQ